MKKTSRDRLDIPGFSFGQKTGEYVDVCRIFGGHESGRTSGVPHSFQELAAADKPEPKRLSRIRATRLSHLEYISRRRQRVKEAHKATAPRQVTPCLRRYLEGAGLPVHDCKYGESPELFEPNAAIAYEVRTEFLSLVSFTSVREAMIMVRTLAKYGVASEFVQIKVP